MKKLIPVLQIGFAILFISQSLRAVPSDTTRENTWSVAAYIGWTLGGVCKHLSDEMEYYGFGDDTQGGGWFGGEGHKYPDSDHSNPSWLIGVNYDLNLPLTITAIGGKSHLGEISGHSYDSSWNNYIRIASTADTYAALLSYNDNSFVRIGIGPAIYNIKSWQHIPSASDDIIFNFQRIGFIVDAKIQIPNRSRFYFEINGQFRYVGKGTIGPFEVRHGSGLPRMEVTYNQGFIGFAFGFRI